MAKSADVLFIYTNINPYHLNVYNFGIGYLSSVLKNNGFYPKLVIVKSKRDYKKVIKTVLEYKPKIVGFSAVSSQFPFVSELAKMIKKVHKCIAVCGGVHPTIFPECLFSAPDLDGIFIGESEFSFLDFVSEITKGNQYKNIDNFCYVEKGKLIKNRLRPRIQNLEKLPFPDRDLYNYQSIIDENDGMVTLNTNRGCPFNCTYCCNHAIARVYGKKQNTIRYNSIENVLAEIDMLKAKYKFEWIWFIDDIFILNKKWLGEFLPEYKKRFNIPFRCHIRPDICTRDILFELREAGCYEILLGVESANDYIRNVVMQRNITKAQLENTFKWAREIGLKTASINIIGVPDETEETIWETINFNKRINPTTVAVNIFNPYDGTKLGDSCRERGLIKKTNPHSFFERRQPKLLLPNISDTKLRNFHNKFQYLVYKDIYALKAKIALWNGRYERLKSRFGNNILIGFLFKKFFKKFRKIVKSIAKKLLLIIR